MSPLHKKCDDFMPDARKTGGGAVTRRTTLGLSLLKKVDMAGTRAWTAQAKTARSGEPMEDKETARRGDKCARREGSLEGEGNFPPKLNWAMPDNRWQELGVSSFQPHGR